MRLTFWDLLTVDVDAWRLAFLHWSMIIWNEIITDENIKEFILQFVPLAPLINLVGANIDQVHVLNGFHGSDECRLHCMYDSKPTLSHQQRIQYLGETNKRWSNINTIIGKWRWRSRSREVHDPHNLLMLELAHDHHIDVDSRCWLCEELFDEDGQLTRKPTPMKKGE